MSESWDIPSAISLYNVDRWGSGYFSINRSGNVQVMPTQQESLSIDLMEVVQEARERGMNFPLVVRFQDLLRHRVETINRAFQSAISEAHYQNVYKGVFPIKVNQLREVVEEIIEAGSAYHFGLEAGSKPELIAALAIHRDLESLIICNGYKDLTYIKLALLGRKLGKLVIMVVEKFEEVRQIVQLSKEMGVQPILGLRVRLQAKGQGRWATSGGENAKFGLSTADLVAASSYLKQEGMADALKLVHFHVGSQVPDIGVIKRAVREAARFFAKLSHMGHPMEYIDVGGGLGVDYDGSRTAFDSSINYTLQEYARDVVYNIMDVVDSEKVAHPTIVSEGGRAIVAHHSVLVVEAFGSIEKGTADLPLEVKESDPKLLADIVEIQRTLTKQNRMENLHDAQQVKEQAQSMFELGLLDLESKAKIETIYWQIAESLVTLCRGMRYVPDEVKELETALGDQYLCNFSVFQSLLDHWALGQLFPIMPIHKLDNPPDRNGTLVDITCDSDGKVNKFIDLQDVKETLPLHRITNGEPYYLGFFLLGAYQDIMGDLHNLFGRVNEVHIFLDEDEDSGWYIEEVIQGSTVISVLSMTQWDQNELVRLVKSQVDAAIKSDRLKPNEAMRILNDYERGLSGYTYLSFNKQI
ncbi:MAG: biosynthetic arginine decarboxylase [Verrucomicrobia bacterium]|nr:biosynthetic arginine decarboxylase [Verrucomicrobiota bacterium]MBV9276006.1 biosynthetic arginine decarboxylase [Verrucomicrobiota bacterium]